MEVEENQLMASLGSPARHVRLRACANANPRRVTAIEKDHAAETSEEFKIKAGRVTDLLGNQRDHTTRTQPSLLR
jgi:hypothetical protein